MEIKFKANSDFDTEYILETGNVLKINAKDGEVTVKVEPFYTSGYLRVNDGTTITTASTAPAKVYTNMPDLGEDDDEIDVPLDWEEDDELCEDEEELFLDSLDKEKSKETDLNKIVSKIREYDKSGTITNLIVSLLNESDDEDGINDKISAYICRIMVNLSDTLSKFKGKLID